MLAAYTNTYKVAIQFSSIEISIYIIINFHFFMLHFLLRDGTIHKRYSITARDGDSNRFTSYRRNPRYTTYAHSPGVTYGNLSPRHHRAGPSFTPPK